MRILGFALLAAVVAYIGGALGGYALVTVVSSNTHDRSLEASMTSIFIVGPLVAVLAFAATLVIGLARRHR